MTVQASFGDVKGATVSNRSPTVTLISTPPSLRGDVTDHYPRRPRATRAVPCRMREAATEALARGSGLEQDPASSRQRHPATLAAGAVIGHLKSDIAAIAVCARIGTSMTRALGAARQTLSAAVIGQLRSHFAGYTAPRLSARPELSGAIVYAVELAIKNAMVRRCPRPIRALRWADSVRGRVGAGDSEQPVRRCSKRVGPATSPAERWARGVTPTSPSVGGG